MDILSSLAGTESGGRFDAQNAEMGHGGQAGHYGRLQFGHARLQDAMRAGVVPEGTTPEQFMADPALQARTEAWHKQDMMRQAERLGLTEYIGQEVGGIPITMDAILAMGHLGGMGGARRFLTSGGRDNPADSFGTSLADYARIHGGQPQTAPQGNALAQQAPEPQQNALRAFVPQAPMLDQAEFMNPRGNAMRSLQPFS